MVWLQVFLIFVGIPAALFMLISFVVMKLTTSRIPDGIAAMQAAAQSHPEEESAEDQPQGASAEPSAAESTEPAWSAKSGDNTTDR